MRLLVIYEAPTDSVAAFLQGLFDADGCVYDGENSRYVGLGSRSRELLVGAQRLLSTFGVFPAALRDTRPEGHRSSATAPDGTEISYDAKAMFDLRISNRSIARFAEHVGFSLPGKAAKLAGLLESHRLNETKETVRLVERTDDGVELTYNLSEPRNHSYIVNGTIVANCSEYMHLDNSACNLRSIPNLPSYLNDNEIYDINGFRHTVEELFTIEEILVGNADYPTKKIGAVELAISVSSGSGTPTRRRS